MNEIISVPELSTQVLKFLDKVEMAVNGVVRYKGDTVPATLVHQLSRHESNVFFNQFLQKIVKTIGRGIDNSNVLYDPFEPIAVLTKQHPDLKFGRFMSKKEAKFVPTFKHGEKDEVTVYFTEVREELVPYLVHKVGKDDEHVKELIELFSSQGNCRTAEEALTKKAKYLMDLDLSDTVKKMNDETRKNQKLFK